MSVNPNPSGTRSWSSFGFPGLGVVTAILSWSLKNPEIFFILQCGIEHAPIPPIDPYIHRYTLWSVNCTSMYPSRYIHWSINIPLYIELHIYIYILEPSLKESMTTTVLEVSSDEEGQDKPEQLQLPKVLPADLRSLLIEVLNKYQQNQANQATTLGFN